MLLRCAAGYLRAGVVIGKVKAEDAAAHARAGGGRGGRGGTARASTAAFAASAAAAAVRFLCVSLVTEVAMLLLITDHAAAYPRAARVCIAAAPEPFLLL